MSESIVRVHYVRAPGHPTTLVGEIRYLNKRDSQLYKSLADAREQRHSTAYGFYQVGGGQYVNRGGYLVEEYPVNLPIIGFAECPYPEPVKQPENPQAFKADAGKDRWSLLMSAEGCAKALAGVVRVLSFAVRAPALGGKGYTPHSWRQVPEAKERYESALYRHLSAINQGETHDAESGESHWHHVATNALFLSELHNV